MEILYLLDGITLLLVFFIGFYIGKIVQVMGNKMGIELSNKPILSKIVKILLSLKIKILKNSVNKDSKRLKNAQDKYKELFKGE